MAGGLIGTSGLPAMTGWGRLSRLPGDSGSRPQLASMNVTSEAWSA